MKKFMGVCAAAALLAGGGAFAGGDKAHKQYEEKPEQTGIQQDQDLNQGLGGSGASGEMQQQGGSLSGELVKKQNDVVFLKLEQGAVVPVKVDQNTQFELKKEEKGQQARLGKQDKQEKQKKGKAALKKIDEGAELTAEVTTKQGQNVADRIEVTEKASQQLEGQIASKSGNWINVRHEGALVPLKVDKETEFLGQGEQQASLQQLSEGDEIRASFQVKGTQNMAKSIELSSSGGQQQQLEQGQQQPQFEQRNQQQQEQPSQQY